MQAKGFLSSLFDYSFSSFVTSRIVRLLYVITTVVLALWTIALVVIAFNISSALGVVALLLVGPLFFVVSLTYARVGLELMIVFFRISENVQAINEWGGGVASPPDAPASDLSATPSPA